MIVNKRDITYNYTSVSRRRMRGEPINRELVRILLGSKYIASIPVPTFERASNKAIYHLILRRIKRVRSNPGPIYTNIFD